MRFAFSRNPMYIWKRKHGARPLGTRNEDFWRRIGWLG
jgi:hypothetical protein